MKTKTANYLGQLKVNEKWGVGHGLYIFFIYNAGLITINYLYNLQYYNARLITQFIARLITIKYRTDLLQESEMYHIE